MPPTTDTIGRSISSQDQSCLCHGFALAVAGSFRISSRIIVSRLLTTSRYSSVRVSASLADEELRLLVRAYSRIIEIFDMQHDRMKTCHGVAWIHTHCDHYGLS